MNIIVIIIFIIIIVMSIVKIMIILTIMFWNAGSTLPLQQHLVKRKIIHLKCPQNISVLAAGLSHCVLSTQAYSVNTLEPKHLRAAVN